MAEPLKITITSDSSELRSDIDKTLKKMSEISNKSKDIQNKLNARGADDFAKTLSSALDDVNKKLEKANDNLLNAEEKFNDASAKAHELFQNGADDDALNKAFESQRKAEEQMLKAQEQVEQLQSQQAQITEQTTNEYNAQTEALSMQKEELSQQFNILEGILNSDTADLQSAKWTDLLKTVGNGASNVINTVKTGADAILITGRKIFSTFNKDSSGGLFGLFKKGTVESTTSAFKSLASTAGTFTMALIGARSAYTLIRKATSQILSDNQQLSNTISTIWNSIVSAITPAVTTIVSTFATILNYVIAIISYISSLDVLGIMKKAQKKANSATGGSSASNKKQQQQYSFDTAETIQKQDSSSSGGVASDVNDSYLKGIKLSGDLLKYAEKLKAIWADIQQIGANLWNGVKEGLKYMNSGQRILEVCKRLLDKFLDDIKKCTEATVEWSANLNFGPLFDSLATVFESLEPILSRIGDLFVFIYTEALLPIATWVIECGLPAVLETIATILDTISALIEASMPGLQDLWESIIKPLGEYLGGAFLDVLENIQSWFESATEWINENQEVVSLIVEVLGTMVVTFIALYTALEVCNTVMAVTSALFAFITSPITLVALAITALIAIVVLLATHWDQVKEAASKCWDNIVATFQSAWQWFNDNVITPISDGFKAMVNNIIGWAEGMANGIIGGVESAVNAVIDLINSFSFDIPDWVPELGGSHFGIDISHVNYGRVSLPRLAKGAVIPPNQEFLAVLGDQTRGKNIEAPEGLLREIVQEESGSQQQINIVAQGEMSQLIKLLRLKLQEEDKRVGSSLVVGG